MIELPLPKVNSDDKLGNALPIAFLITQKFLKTKPNVG
jgi:hypothetical protein